MEQEIFNMFIDDMVANAFIELNNIENNERVNEIPLAIIEKYGDEVAKKIVADGNKVAFCLSRESYEKFKFDYNDFFTTKEGTNSSVILNDRIETEDLIKKFRGYLPFKLLLAYMDKEVVKKGLLEPMGLKQGKVIQKK